MKNLIFILAMLCFFGTFAKQKDNKVYALYVFVWNNTETYTGAGHVSVAIENKDGTFDYFSHYMEDDGGGHHVKKTTFIDAYYYDSDSLKIQKATPGLVMRIELSAKERKKAHRIAKRKIKNRWHLFKGNCADFAKAVVNKSGCDGGLAFMISTPYEMVKDVNDHNKKQMESGKLSVIIGDIKAYLKNQPASVPNTIKKWFSRTFSTKKPVVN